jgi:Fic family protein
VGQARVTTTRTFSRAASLAIALERGQELSAPYIRMRYGVSHAQARRDIRELGRLIPLERRITRDTPEYVTAPMFALYRKAK